MPLQHARVTKQRTIFNVPPSKELPIPTEFDFEHPVPCARRILAMMSQAGGHSLRACTLSYSKDKGIANISGLGVNVLYAPPQGNMLTMEQVAALHTYKVQVLLGTVVTETSWETAKWVR